MKRFLVGLLVVLAFTLAGADAEQDARDSYRRILQYLQPDRVRDTARNLAQFDRFGTPAPQALQWLKGPRGLGVLGEVREERYRLTVPDHSATAQIATRHGVVTVHPLWPNGVRTSTTNVSGNLIYAGDGRIERFNGQRVRDSIVLMDFNSGQAWRTAARLGARAVIFLEPSTTQRSEGEAKWSTIPHSLPRFYGQEAEAGRLMAAVGSEVSVSCNQPWVDIEAANLIAALPGNDPHMRDQWVVIMAYSDTVSVVPGLQHGADQGSGAAALVELAQTFAKTGSARSVLFVLTSGHFQAMQGLNAFLEQRFRRGWDVTGGKEPYLFLTLDLSSRNTAVAALANGWWVDYRGENIEDESRIARTLRLRATGIAELFRYPERQLFFDGVGNPDGRHWKNNVPGRFVTQAEMINMAGLNGITLFTQSDARDLQDTPFDTIDNVRIGNLVLQTRFIACMLHHALNDTRDEAQRDRHSVPFRRAPTLKRMSLMGGFGTVSGRVLRYDPRRSFLPDVPMTGALVQVSNRFKSYLGVRGAVFARAVGEDARYEVYGVPPITAWLPADRGMVGAWGYVVGEDGEITYSLDFGPQGTGQFDTLFEMTTTYRETPVVVFGCVPVELYGLIDPHLLESLSWNAVLDAATNGDPRQYSILAPFKLPGSVRSQIEASAVAFALPGTRIKLLGALGMGDVRMILSNGTPQNPEGDGFAVEQVAGTFPDIWLQAARDMYYVNEQRLERMRRHNIINPGLEDLQASALERLQAAELASGELRHSDADRHARAAWGFALRAHPQLMQMTKDVLNGLIFYLLLLLPFCYFLERLLVGSTRLSTQIVWAGVAFAVSFAALRLLHPAFELTGNTFMIFVAFAIGALSLIVITFVVGKFEAGLQKLQQQAEGVHDETVGKFGLALTALSIGISNMRRRRARTILTCATLVLVTFIVLSFTSILPDLRFNELAAPGEPRYSGILLRNLKLEPLEDNAFRSLEVEFSGQAAIGRRAWFYGAQLGAQSVLSLSRDGRMIELKALLGMDPVEAEITGPQAALLLGGRWFREGEPLSIILPESVAGRLGIRPQDVGSAVVTFGGAELTVIGLAEDARLAAVFDLDNESILPADFGLSDQLQQQGGGDFAFRDYVRVDASTMCIVPAETAINLGADLRTVAVAFTTGEQTAAAMERIMPRMGLNLYAAVPGSDGLEIKRFSTVASTRGRGLEYVIIPVLIAIVIVLNTMIASVLERTREIGIFSAIGLSPRHIASLFFAESLVYAVLGAVFGYFLAQIAGKVVAMTGAFPGIYLNYSSVSAVAATLVVVLVVLLSTIYPARKAGQIATPSGGNEWSAEQPQSDTWIIPLPFTVTAGHAAALSKFYAEWFEGYEEFTVGDFVTQDVRAWGEQDGHYVETRCWLSPFDLGVQQTLTLMFEPTELQDVYDIALKLERISGDPEHWESLNRRFLNSLRRQFLIWRTLSPQEKAHYLQPATA